MAEAVHIC